MARRSWTRLDEANADLQAAVVAMGREGTDVQGDLLEVLGALKDHGKVARECEPRGAIRVVPVVSLRGGLFAFFTAPDDQELVLLHIAYFLWKRGQYGGPSAWPCTPDEPGWIVARARMDAKGY